MRNRDSNPGFSAPEADALTTRPVRRCLLTWPATLVDNSSSQTTSTSLSPSPPSQTVKSVYHCPCCHHHRRRHFHNSNRLVGLVVKASASRAEDPGFESRLRRDYSWSSHTSDSKIGTPVATLPGAWRYRVSHGTGRPGVSIL